MIEKTIKQFEKANTSQINRRRGGQRSNTKTIQKQINGFKNQNKQLKDILESLPKAPKIIEKPKVPKITKNESSKKSNYMDLDVGILDKHDLLLQLKNTESLISNFLLDTLKQMHGMKLNISLDIIFMKQDEKEQEAFFKTKTKGIINEHDIGDAKSDSNNKLLNRISEWISKDSGWIIKSVDTHELNVIKNQPLRGSSYLPLPDKYKKKQ